MLVKDNSQDFNFGQFFTEKNYCSWEPLPDDMDEEMKEQILMKRRHT